MKLPTKCDMEDISSLSEIITQYIFTAFMGGPKKTLRETSLYRQAYFRLIDKAIYDYNKAREYLILQINEPKRTVDELQKGRIIYLFSFINSIENCIITLRRLLLIFERIQRNKDKLPLSRIIKKSIFGNQQKAITIRNIIIHFDEEICEKGERKEFMPIISINENEDGIVISDYELKFVDISTLLINLHEIAKEILNW